MNRFLIFCFLSILALSEPCKADFQGFYLGQSFGNAHNTGNFSSESSSVADFGLPHTLTLSSSGKGYNESFFGEVYGGYGCIYFCHLYVGLRLGASLSDFDVKNRSSSSLSQTLSSTIPISSTITNSLKGKLWLPEVTIDQKIGWVFNERTLVFGLVGVALNQPSLKGFSVASDTGGGDTPFDGSVSFSLDKKGQLAHFRWGVGLDYKFTCNWAVQLLYTQTNYGRLRFSGSGIDSDGESVSLSATSSIKAKLGRKVFSIGFSRYF